METKHIVALMLMLVLALGSFAALTIWPRLRPWALFATVFGSIISNWMDFNLFGQYWYRGTTRGVEISWVDVLAFGLLAAELVSPRHPRHRWLWPAGLGFFVLYLLYCCVSVATATPKHYGVWELANVFRAAMIIVTAAMLVRTRHELSIFIWALVAAVFVEAVYGLKQRFLSGIYRVPGTFDHENTLSTYLCTVAPLLVAAALSNWSKWLRLACGVAVGVALVLELLTISRAGIPIFVFCVGGTAFFCVTWRITRQKIFAGLAIVVVGGALFATTWEQIASRYESASFAEEYLDEEKEGRGVYFRWANAMMDDEPFGVGLNNWSYYVSKTYGGRLGFRYEDYDDVQDNPEKADLPAINYAAPAHSLVALTMGELGIPGLILMAAFWLRWFQLGATFLWNRLNADPMHRLGIGCLFGLAGVFLSNATEWTYRQSGIIFTCHLVAGVLASLIYVKKHEAAAPDEESEDDGDDDGDPADDEEIEVEAEVIPTNTR